MDKLEKYRQVICDVLTEYAQTPFIAAQSEELEEQLLLDRATDHYAIVNVGWRGSDRIYSPVFHLDLKNGKVWVQEDATDFDIVQELETRGIPKLDIVLGFQAPFKRKHTGFAVA